MIWQTFDGDFSGQTIEPNLGTGPIFNLSGGVAAPELAASRLLSAAG